MKQVQEPLDLQAGAVIYIDKPLGWSSFAVVNKFRYLASQHLGVKRLKVGHAGTLDPLASGVMVLCTGRSTKLIESLQQGTKEYIAEIRLGATTPSFDLESPIDATYPTEHITKDLVEDTLPSFLGEIDQIPPVFSACKIGGQRAYDLARRGRDVELAPKRITIHELELLEAQLPSIRLRVLCGKGTYIRSLARDLGKALSSGGHLTSLRRTQVGSAHIDNCITIDEIPQWLSTHTLSLKQEYNKEY